MIYSDTIPNVTQFLSIRYYINPISVTTPPLSTFHLMDRRNLEDSMFETFLFCVHSITATYKSLRSCSFDELFYVL
jgi:hypothetical protein